MATNPTAKKLAEEALWAHFRHACTKLDHRQRNGLRLVLLREQAKQGDHTATHQAEQLAARLKKEDAMTAHAAELRNQDHGLTEAQARYLAEVAFSNTNRTDNND